eukprot:TRINITY_DN11405_c1_g1_i1.p2 TRINITY_DN11405_c1_g1~~TRINITY_DN11405_c1_g1_i1.p2  ORF type:complete len:108 (+),score=31.75 TRINITY_DN11405_c1_g1_i1:78-401(+)
MSDSPQAGHRSILRRKSSVHEEDLAATLSRQKSAHYDERNLEKNAEVVAEIHCAEAESEVDGGIGDRSVSTMSCREEFLKHRHDEDVSEGATFRDALKAKIYESDED